MDRTLLRFRGIQPNDKDRSLRAARLHDPVNCDAVALNARPACGAPSACASSASDCGAGSSTVFSVMRGAVLELKSCRIEGGFGRSPENGSLFDVRSSAFLAHFEDCTIDMVRINQHWWRNGIDAHPRSLPVHEPLRQRVAGSIGPTTGSC
jgi:hypothetical protein